MGNGKVSLGKGERTIGAKVFQYKLKTVLEMRTRQLEHVQQRFAVQQHRVIELQTLLDENRQQIQDQMGATSEQMADPVIAQQRFRYVQYLRIQAANLVETLAKENQVLERIREEMRQAHIRKKSLEKLEEKQRIAYHKDLDLQEEKELEDLVIARGNRF